MLRDWVYMLALEWRHSLKKIAAESTAVSSIPRDTIFGDANADYDLPVDVQIGLAIEARLRALAMLSHPLPVRQLLCEGQSAPTIINPAGTIDVFCDPCDGSLNFHKRGMTDGLPYCTVVTFVPVMPDNQPARYRDILGAIVIDLRECNTVYVAAQQDGVIHPCIYSHRAPLGVRPQVDKTAISIDGQHVYGGENYYPASRALLAKLYGDQKVWARNTGAAGLEMVSVGAGVAAMWICSEQKSDVLGAAYLFCTGAGAVCVTLNGTSLGDEVYDFTAQVPIGIFATEALKDECLRRLNA